MRKSRGSETGWRRPGLRLLSRLSSGISRALTVSQSTDRERRGGECIEGSPIHPVKIPAANFTWSIMPKKQTIERARRDQREGKSASTQAGEFVREEIEEIRAGKHGARSTKQAIAIGLSKARRAGVKLAPPKPGKTSEATRKKAQQDLQKADSGMKPSARRSRATLKALQRESSAAAAPEALSRQTRTAARKRSAAERSASAKRAARTRAEAE
jgi:Family of unknown function (DUF6496)